MVFDIILFDIFSRFCLPRYGQHTIYAYNSKYLCNTIRIKLKLGKISRFGKIRKKPRNSESDREKIKLRNFLGQFGRSGNPDRDCSGKYIKEVHYKSCKKEKVKFIKNYYLIPGIRIDKLFNNQWGPKELKQISEIFSQIHLFWEIFLRIC